MKINEIFYSLQGEGSQIGYPFIFIRFAECNLRCAYCDTKYSFDEGKQLSLQEILQLVKALPVTDKILLTGGEPLLQKEAILELIQAFTQLDKKIYVETNGTIDIGFLPTSVVKIIDVKTPSSGYPHSFLEKNLTLMTSQDELKFVISDREDFDFSVHFIRNHRIIGKFEILFSAAKPRIDDKTLAKWILESAIPVRLNIQLHKWLDLK